MPTTNALQWNPTAVNQENDATYLTDTQRLGGAANPSLFDARLANKLFYQLTTYVTALGQMLANKGYTTSDASLSVLTNVLANIQTTADIKSGLQLVTFSPTLTFNCLLSNGFEVVLTGNLTSLTISGAVVGQIIMLAFVQDGVGGRTVAYPANLLGAGTINSVAGSTSMQLFQVLADNKLHPLSIMTVS